MGFLRVTFILSFIVAACITLINGHPSGAPESTCDTMTVVHDNPDGPQPDASSYMAMVSSAQVATGGTISVYVMSDYLDKFFEGILIKVIDASQADTDFSGAAGTFTIADADADLFHYLNCSGSAQSAVTHSSSVEKTDVTFTWQAPSTPGTYVFALTIVQDHDVYWLPFRSDSIEVTAA